MQSLRKLHGTPLLEGQETKDSHNTDIILNVTPPVVDAKREAKRIDRRLACTQWSSHFILKLGMLTGLAYLMYDLNNRQLSYKDKRDNIKIKFGDTWVVNSKNNASVTCYEYCHKLDVTIQTYQRECRPYVGEIKYCSDMVMDCDFDINGNMRGCGPVVRQIYCPEDVHNIRTCEAVIDSYLDAKFTRVNYIVGETATALAMLLVVCIPKSWTDYLFDCTINKFLRKADVDFINNLGPTTGTTSILTLTRARDRLSLFQQAPETSESIAPVFDGSTGPAVR